MTLTTVVDNDILIKGAAYRLLDTLLSLRDGDVGILGAARFVVDKRLQRHPGLSDRDGARAHWQQFLQQATEIEPTDEELSLATTLEEVASRESFSLDVGESQLCAVTVIRALEAFLTGDKRAVTAIEQLLPHVQQLAVICGHVIILEQVCELLFIHLGGAKLKDQICREPSVDTAMRICFHCSGDCGDDDIAAALESYIRDARNSAPSVLI